MIGWSQVFDVLRGVVLGVLLCAVLLKLLGTDTGVLDFRYAGY